MKMQFLILSAIATCVLSVIGSEIRVSDYDVDFSKYMSKHKLNPRDGTEKAHWQKSYAANRVLIDQWNADPTNTCQLGETKWAHFTNAEFAALPQFNGRKNKQMYSTDVATANLRADRITTTLRPTGPTRLPTRIPTKAPVSSVPTVPTQAPVGPPPAFDWTTQTVNGAPVVGPIKDQAQCGSCWAFSSVSTLESAYTIKYGVHKIYSEQQVVSCDSSCTIVGGYNECNQGCNGGWEDTVYAWVNSNGGLASSAAYPYTSATGVTGTCITTGYTNDATLKPTGKVQVTTGSTAALQAAVATTPTQVAIDGSSSVFQLYVSGVITSGCGTKSDHAVVVVGYDLTAPTPYFKVRNSWGTSWGQNGYVYISSNQASNTCIILSDPAYPLLS